jgi:NADPH:quinone reductase
MKSVRLHRYGGTENFRVEDVAVPTVGSGEVVVSVQFAGLRWGDIMQRNGLPVPFQQTPFIAGQEAAGTVSMTGLNVSGVSIGDRVCVFPTSGAFAEKIAVPATSLIKVPDNVPLEKCLAYPVNLRTAYFITYVWGKVKEGETVLLHAAAGGVGLLVLQILKRKFKNVCVIGIVGSDEKCEIIKRRGCDYAVNRSKEDYIQRVTEITGPKVTGFTAVGDNEGGGVHVSFNGVSGSTIATDPKVIRKRGRFVIYGYSGGPATIDTSSYGYDGITIMPFSTIAWSGTPEDKAANQFVAEWLASEELIEPEIWSLDDVAAAEDALEAGKTIGKVVFRVS